MATVKTRVASYTDRAIRGLAHWVTYRELHLNQAQLCVVPVSSETTSRATRRRRS
jgi:hypothetical protein